jgi:hypothetical protein
MLRTMVRKIVDNKKVRHYLIDAMQMYNFGRVSLPM